VHVAVVVVVVVAACSFEAPRRETQVSPDAAVPPPPTIDAPVPEIDAPVVATLTPRIYIEQLVTLECQQAFACQSQYPPNKQPSFANAWGTDLDDCVTTDRDYLDRDAVDAGIAAGRITWDPAAAMTCLAAPGIPTSCSTLFNTDYDFAPSCIAALIGHVPDGGACTTGWECSSTSYCRNGTCGHS